jgi:hypothetical protein
VFKFSLCFSVFIILHHTTLGVSFLLFVFQKLKKEITPQTKMEKSTVEQVQSVIIRLMHNIDGKKWTELRTCFDNSVKTDYTSLFGGTPVESAGDDLINGWKKNLDKVITQHLLGPIDVNFHSATSATGECHVVGSHFFGAETWMVYGHYVFEITLHQEGWKVGYMKLETYAQTGVKDLLAKAAAAT